MLKSGSCRHSFSDMDVHTHTLSLCVSCVMFSCTFKISFGISSSFVFAKTHLLYIVTRRLSQQIVIILFRILSNSLCNKK